jgi:hypothetical protein
MAKLDNNQQPPRKGRPPVKVEEKAIRALFAVPQPSAAKALGISLTALKQVCRKLNIPRWPYQRGGTQQVADEHVARVAVGSRFGSEASTASTHRDTAPSRTNSGGSMTDDTSDSCDPSDFVSPAAVAAAHENLPVPVCTSYDTETWWSSELFCSSESEGDDSDDLLDDDMDRILAIDGPWVEQYAREATQFDSLMLAA